MSERAADWLGRIKALDIAAEIRILNVCGGHERSIAQAGLRGVLPQQITLIPGPGCPVCVCPEADILAAIRLAQDPRNILVAFGDMLRVPVNGPKNAVRSLAAARSAGADVRPIASPDAAAEMALENPGRNVIFFAAGFETTAAPVAAMLAAGIPGNLSLLLALRRTWPAVAMLLESEPAFEGLIAPGHVAAVMGADEWGFVVTRHAMPAAVAGFTAGSLLAALYDVLLQSLGRQPKLGNAYPAAVRPAGNLRARACLDAQFEDFDAAWRGIGTIPASGFRLRPHQAAHDARQKFAAALSDIADHAEAMPPGCDCARVIMGKCAPLDCRLYGRACTPRTPVGPCMVSDEGACRIWWAAGERHAA